MCIDMCVGGWTCMCTDICINVCIDLRIDLCMDMSMDVHVYRHVYGHVYRHVYRHVHGHVYTCGRSNGPQLRPGASNMCICMLICGPAHASVMCWWRQRVLTRHAPCLHTCLHACLYTCLCTHASTRVYASIWHVYATDTRLQRVRARTQQVSYERHTASHDGARDGGCECGSSKAGDTAARR